MNRTMNRPQQKLIVCGPSGGCKASHASYCVCLCLAAYGDHVNWNYIIKNDTLLKVLDRWLVASIVRTFKDGCKMCIMDVILI